jgi:hypothetical protein
VTLALQKFTWLKNFSSGASSVGFQHAYTHALNETCALPLSSDQYDAICETVSIQTDPVANGALRIGIAQLNQGKTIPWEKVKERLGL